MDRPVSGVNMEQWMFQAFELDSSLDLDKLVTSRKKSLKRLSYTRELDQCEWRYGPRIGILLNTYMEELW